MDILTHLSQARLFENESFEGLDAAELDLSGKEFEGCTFRQAKLMETRWKGTRLEDCVFEDCDLTRARPDGLTVRGATFRRCKLMGIDWSGVGRNPTLTFEDCDLRYVSFVSINLRRTKLLRCRAVEANFIEADLTEADFAGCDLTGSVFERSTLVKARFGDTQGLYVDPAKNRVKGARLPIEAAVLLAMSFGFQVEGYGKGA